MGGISQFPTLKRKTANVPGPGKYSIPEGFGPSSGSRHVSILSARNRQVVPDPNIGPGSYDKGSTLSGPSFTIAAPVPMPGGGVSQSGSMGPKYDVHHFAMARNPTSPRFTMGGGRTPNSPRKQEAQPGPGSYSYEPDTDVLSKFKKASVRIGPPPMAREGDSGRALGPPTEAQHNPGPGSYETKRFGDGGKVSPGVQPSKARRVSDQTPGPGSYDVIHHTIENKLTPRETMVPSTTFGGKGHPLVGSSCAPGPGEYSVSSEWLKGGVTIGNKHQSYGDFDGSSQKPGPGEYRLPSVAFPESKKGFSIGPRYESPRPPPNPGPGSYDIRRGDLTDAVDRIKKEATLRGPDSPRNKQTTPRILTSKTTPGPGAYALPSYLDTTHGVSIGPSTDSTHWSRSQWLADLSSSPGPGTYDFDKHTKANTKGSTFYKGQISESTQSMDTPGPGAYNDAEGFDATRSSRVVQFTRTSHLT